MALFALSFAALRAFQQAPVAVLVEQVRVGPGTALPVMIPVHRVGPGPAAVALVMAALWLPSLAAAGYLALRLRPVPVAPLVLASVAVAVLACLAVMVFSLAPMAGPAARGTVPVRVEQVVPQQ